VTANIAPVKTFSYDPVGNLLSKSDIGYTDGITQNGPLGRWTHATRLRKQRPGTTILISWRLTVHSVPPLLSAWLLVPLTNTASATCCSAEALGRHPYRFRSRGLVPQL
jgi:hypothetical protein